MTKKPKTILRRALRVNQNEEHPLYLFSMTGREILDFADVSKVSRDSAGKLIGYQRPEVKRHVQEIVEYLDSEDIVFPNSIILALSPDAKFKSSRGPATTDGLVTAGQLEIPVPKEGADKPAWIVDGQQRTLALSKSSKAEFPVPVSAFIADSVALQRDQFLRVNNTKPLPRGLVTELLPDVSTPLPPRLAARRIPSELCDLLNRTDDSPFHLRIRRASSSAEEKRKALITDTSVVKMIEESISSPSGCLFPYRNMATGETDFDGIWEVLTTYWNSVAVVFDEAWNKPPAKSRLTHGVGIRAMGRLMDRVMGAYDPKATAAEKGVRKQLEAIAPFCSWTSGVWEELGGMRWNDLQNVPRHINLLSNFIIRKHLQQIRG